MTTTSHDIDNHRIDIVCGRQSVIVMACGRHLWPSLPIMWPYCLWLSLSNPICSTCVFHENDYHLHDTTCSLADIMPSFVTCADTGYCWEWKPVDRICGDHWSRRSTTAKASILWEGQ